LILRGREHQGFHLVMSFGCGFFFLLFGLPWIFFSSLEDHDLWTGWNELKNGWVGSGFYCHGEIGAKDGFSLDSRDLDWTG
jgi:hypothetical protein